MITNIAEGIQAFTSNAFFVDGERPVLVDTGANFDAVSALERHLDEQTTLEAVVLTHAHADHVGNLEAIRSAFDVDVWGYDPTVADVTIDHAIEDGSQIRLGDHEYVAIHTPGHKDDHLCLYAANPGICFGGDLVFQNGSFGRTDLPEGDRRTLIESIDRLLETVDPSLAQLHVGHGPSIVDQPYENIELAGQMARQY